MVEMNKFIFTISTIISMIPSKFKFMDDSDRSFSLFSFIFQNLYCMHLCIHVNFWKSFLHLKIMMTRHFTNKQTKSCYILHYNIVHIVFLVIPKRDFLTPSTSRTHIILSLVLFKLPAASLVFFLWVTLIIFFSNVHETYSTLSQMRTTAQSTGHSVRVTNNSKAAPPISQFSRHDTIKFLPCLQPCSSKGT